MTQKELLYVEDAIQHECTMITDCTKAIDLVTDENLKNFLNEQVENHTQTKERLINLLEEKSNEW